MTAQGRRVLVVADDLMIRSRIEAAAPPETRVVFAQDSADFAAQLQPPPDLILVGLAATRLPWADLLRTARARVSTPIIAFGPHRDLELRQRALDAGVDRVLANSALMIALPGLLRGEIPAVAEVDPSG